MGNECTGENLNIEVVMMFRCLMRGIMFFSLCGLIVVSTHSHNKQNQDKFDPEDISCILFLGVMTISCGMLGWKN